MILRNMRNSLIIGTIVTHSDEKTIDFDQTPSMKSKEKTDATDLTDEVIVYSTARGSKYHLESCRFIRVEEDLMFTIDEAKAKGLKACQICKPPQ